MADAPKILATDTLRQSYPKLNQAIDNSNTANKSASAAFSFAKEANDKSDNTQSQLNQVVIEGDSSVEAAQARVDDKGEVFPTLKNRLDTSDEKVDSRELKNKVFKKKVFKELPLRFADYQTIVNNEAVTYIYPQSFTIDWQSNEIFLVYSPTGGTSSKRWIVVFDLNSASYKRVFSAGNGGGEGIVIKYEPEGRFLYVKSSGRSLGKYNINTLPTNLSTLTPVAQYDVGLHYEFTYRNGTWMVEQGGAVTGNYIRRTLFNLYNDDFQLTGTINFNISDGGFGEGDYYNYLPKRQGIALGDSEIYQAIGGAALKSDQVDMPIKYQGIKVYNQSGKFQSEGIMHHVKMMEVLEQHGYTCERVENEGVHVDPDDNVYTMFVYQGRFTTTSNQEGILIFAEFNNELDAIDFTTAATTYQNFDEKALSASTFPRSADGDMYHPLTGAKLDSFNKICDFMAQGNVPRFSFYSSATSVVDISGVAVPATTLVIINNSNNETFFVEYLGDPNNKRYMIYGPANARQQKEIYYKGDTPEVLTLGSGVSNYFAQHPLAVKRDAEGFVVLDGMVNVPETRPVRIATLPSKYRPPANLSFVVALSASTFGGYGVITVQANGEINLVYTSSNVTYTSLNGIVYKN